MARRALVALLIGAYAAALAFEPQIADDTLPALVTAVVACVAGAYLEGWRSWFVVAALLAIVAVAGDGLVPGAIMTVAPWWIGAEIRRRRLVIVALEQRNAELEAEEDAFAQLSVQRERARLARELHDIIGHHLAVIVVQAGAGRMDGERTEHAAERLTAIRASAGEALAELAHLVDVLDADHGARRPRIALLLERARSSGLRVDVTAPDVALPAPVEDAAYRVLQEALTNVLKHAPGAAVDVRLSRREDALELSVRNAGDGASVSGLAGSGSGLGLQGMRERVGALGGELAFGPSTRGDWVVQARLPLAASPHGMSRSSTRGATTGLATAG